MELDRRELLKLGLLGGAASMGLALPFGSSASTADWISTLPAGKRPTPYTRPFVPAPRLPYRELSDADGPYRLYSVTERLGSAQIIDGLPTPVLGYGYQGIDGQPRLSVPGPVISVPQGTRVKLRVRNRAAGDAPDLRPRAVHHLDPPARLGVAAAVRRLRRRRRRTPGDYKDYWYPNWQPAADPLVPRPQRAQRRRRTPTADWPRSTTCTTPPSWTCCRRGATMSR